MASHYWIKLYHVILDDPKMGRLPDRIFRRTIEVFLIAGELQEDGLLPSIEDMAWRLRLTPEELESDLVELAKVGIVQQLDRDWHVTHFSDRQAAVPGAERMRQLRERKRKEEYYGSDEPVTFRHTEQEQEEDTETDTDTEQQQESVVVLLEGLGLSSSQIPKLINDFSEPKLLEAIDVYKYAHRNGHANGPGYLVSFLLEGWEPPPGYQPDPDSESSRRRYFESEFEDFETSSKHV